MTILIKDDGSWIDYDYNTHIKYWHNKKGYFHNENGPAIETNDGDKWWYINGKCHREDGPAIECKGRKRWFIDNKEYTEEEYKRIVRLLYLI